MAITRENVNQMVENEHANFAQLVEKLLANGPADAETAQEILESTVRYRKFARIQRAFENADQRTQQD